MSQVIAIHSFRGGTGKSNIVANLAALLAQAGRRVGVVDTDILSPGIHVLFGLHEDQIPHALNDYLWGRCRIEEAAYDVTARLDGPAAGRLYLIPASIQAGEIARMIREGYSVELLRDGFLDLIDVLQLDVLLIDTHPGLNDETLLSIAVADRLVILLRPDQQDYEGTGVTLEVARKLGVPEMLIVVNKVPAVFDPVEVEALVARTYRCEVVAVLPHADELMALASRDLFTVRFPDHPISRQLARVAARWVD